MELKVPQQLPTRLLKLQHSSSSWSLDYWWRGGWWVWCQTCTASSSINSVIYLPPCLPPFLRSLLSLRDPFIFQDAVMVGLHTCGNLAPSTLRMFVAKPELAAVCSVGCCYHLLSEEFDPAGPGLDTHTYTHTHRSRFIHPSLGYKYKKKLFNI